MKFHYPFDEDFSMSWLLSLILVMLVIIIIFKIDESFDEAARQSQPPTAEKIEQLKKEINPLKLTVIEKALNKETGIYFSATTNWLWYDMGSKKVLLADFEREYSILRDQEIQKSIKEKVDEKIEEDWNNFLKTIEDKK